MNKLTVDKIIKHSKDAQTVYSKVSDSFRKNFHLRPTENNITIVSTLPYAPMRGLVVAPEDLPKKLSEIKKKLPSLLSQSESKCQEILQEIGFPERKNKSALEENIQALFIRGMINGEEEYQGIRFIASELTLGDRKRFDVVGYKNDTLYIFELKRSRDTKAAPQAKTYSKYVMANIDSFKKVLAFYPNFPVTCFKQVKGIAVMPYAERTRYQTWEEWRKAAERLQPSKKHTLDISDIDIWLFKESLAFTKLLSC